jgi:hypothetical protein
LVALAALSILLLLLLKKRKKADEPEERGGESPVGTIDEGDEYVSEYGLSERFQPDDSDEDDEDLPYTLTDNTSDESTEAEQLSEYNPDES